MHEDADGQDSAGAHCAEFEIRLRGYLPEYRSDSFDGMTVTHDGAGNTVLRGPVADQAALHGLLDRVRDLGIPLLSLVRVEGTGAP